MDRDTGSRVIAELRARIVGEPIAGLSKRTLLSYAKKRTEKLGPRKGRMDGRMVSRAVDVASGRRTLDRKYGKGWGVWGLYSISPPCERCGDEDGGQECIGALVVAGCDAPKVFEATDHALDPVTELVSCGVEGAGVFPCRIGRDHRFAAALGEPVAALAGMIGPVGDRAPWCGEPS